MRKWIFAIVIAALTAVGSIWYLARPKGDIRLAVDAGHSEDDAKAIHRLFNAAGQSIREIVAFHNILVDRI
jgi:hypothetical protein